LAAVDRSGSEGRARSSVRVDRIRWAGQCTSGYFSPSDSDEIPNSVISKYF
jgi:hypothetical protein